MIPGGRPSAPPPGGSLHTLATEKFEIRVIALSGFFGFFGKRFKTRNRTNWVRWGTKPYDAVFFRFFDRVRWGTKAYDAVFFRFFSASGGCFFLDFLTGSGGE